MTIRMGQSLLHEIRPAIAPRSLTTDRIFKDKKQNAEDALTATRAETDWYCSFPAAAKRFPMGLKSGM
jgi:hypothetical protein